MGSCFLAYSDLQETVAFGVYIEPVHLCINPRPTGSANHWPLEKSNFNLLGNALLTGFLQGKCDFKDKLSDG